MKLHYRSDEKPYSSLVSFKDARKLAGEHGTPLLVCDLNRVKANYDKLRSMLPGADLYYAVKANPHPKIIKALIEKDSHFDVASKNEISLCLESGAKPEQLIYANPVKPPEYIRFAMDNGVKRFTYDSVGEVEKMAKHAPGAEVMLRLAVRDVGSYCKFSTKFGAREALAMRLLRAADDAGLKPIGLSFHVGSQCTRIENYAAALDMCARVVERANKDRMDLSMIDIGGGIPIRYIRDVYSFEDLSELLKQKIEELFPEKKIIMEPGRPMVGDAMTLITRVIGVSKRNERNCIYLDDGVYNSLSEKVFGHCEYRIVSDSKGPMTKYTVFGPTCDSMDVISNDSIMPEVKENDLLLVLNAGAYTNAAATHFNGFDPAKILFL